MQIDRGLPPPPDLLDRVPGPKNAAGEPSKGSLRFVCVCACVCVSTTHGTLRNAHGPQDCPQSVQDCPQNPQDGDYQDIRALP